MSDKDIRITVHRSERARRDGAGLAQMGCGGGCAPGCCCCYSGCCCCTFHTLAALSNALIPSLTQLTPPGAEGRPGWQARNSAIRTYWLYVLALIGLTLSLEHLGMKEGLTLLLVLLFMPVILFLAGRMTVYTLSFRPEEDRQEIRSLIRSMHLWVSTWMRFGLFIGLIIASLLVLSLGIRC